MLFRSKEDIDKYNLCDKNFDYTHVECKSFLENVWRVPSHLQSMVIDTVLKELTSTFLQIQQSGETTINKQ